MIVIMEDKKTCLYDAHLALGAQMTVFGGFCMPLYYEGIESEHKAVRTAAGMFDVSHMGEFVISGHDAKRFVNHIFTNDVSSMAPGDVMYGMLLNENGGTVDDLMVYRLAFEAGWLLVVNAANIEKDFDWVAGHGNGFDVEVRNVSELWGEIALQGPEAEALLSSIPEFAEAGELAFYTFRHFDYGGEEVMISRTGYTGEDGFEIYASTSCIKRLWTVLLDKKAVPCGLGCRDTLRFEAALPLYGHELSDTVCPVEAGLGVFVKTDKQEFIGRDAVLKLKEEGLKRKLVGIELLDRAIPRAGYQVLDSDGNAIGEVTTGYRSISLDKSLCMAYVDMAHSALGTELQIAIRRKVFPAVVVRKRFYTPKYRKQVQ